jgi:hypothetical protein
MARKKKDVYHVGPLTEGKKNIIAALMDEYEIETADDIQEALKDLLGGTEYSAVVRPLIRTSGTACP